jgi:hypothetical protein
VAQGVDFLVAQLENIPWEGTVALVKDGKIILNRGTREGLVVGDKFDVGKIEQIVDDDTGEVLASDMTRTATIEVTSVKEKVAYAKLLSGSGVQKGMTIFPAR